MSPLDALIPDPWFPFEGDIRVKPLQPPVVPELPRSGETADACTTCAAGDERYLWCAERWRLKGYRDTPFPGVVLLETRAHHDSYADLPDDLLAEIGPLTARIERVLLALGGVGRVHLARWGDGSAHFHQWFLPRPLGAMQLRGSMLPMWLDLLPALPDAQLDDAFERIGSALRAGD